MIYFILFLLLWLLCSFLTLGIFLAYFQRNWPTLQEYDADIKEGLLFSLGGPISLLVAIPCSRFLKYGWTLRNIHKE